MLQALGGLEGGGSRFQGGWAAQYDPAAGLDLAALNWYVGFAYFKFAAIVAGIVARSAAGAMAGKDTSGYADRIDPCVEMGRAALDEGAI